ncbi:LAMI_0D00914g1_1 [Lachancea mirantina]|uniref:LAMI_0D00914g1_1 n=1 Tax=Lachancea mirantina TaxID=1230905 RepID=A0A1G4J8I9_9SACH|nr:LAMI_0D00914g1_1 [Lachancea mirantina]
MDSDRGFKGGTRVDHDDISKLPGLILGGATLNTQYNEDPEAVPLVQMLRLAFDRGFRAIDTSPYYGESEKLFGEALDVVRGDFPRDSYYICTKVGRISVAEFDYSRENVRFSVKRSCERLGTEYLDMVFLHDIEFIETPAVLEALEELRSLKDEGLIRNFGASGYPVDFLLEIAIKCSQSASIGPLDAVLSYANLNIQNTLLADYYVRFKRDAKVKVVENGSILSMSLLRSQETRAFHPCSQELRDLAQKAAQYAASEGEDLADLATRYAMSKWYGLGPTVLGVSTVYELEHALSNYDTVMDNDGQLSERDQMLVNYIQSQIFKTHLNETWESGIPHR